MTGPLQGTEAAAAASTVAIAASAAEKRPGGEAAGGRPSGSDGQPGVTGGASSAPSAEIAGKRYLNEHFAYIRDLILKSLVYPHAARRMGWTGKVVVAFVVTSDGRADNIRVIRGSGHQILDSNAVETVRKAAPFPRPPVAAELVLPIVYHLE
jgi:protein TonB